MSASRPRSNRARRSLRALLRRRAHRSGPRAAETRERGQRSPVPREPAHHGRRRWSRSSSTTRSTSGTSATSGCTATASSSRSGGSASRWSARPPSAARSKAACGSPANGRRCVRCPSVGAPVPRPIERTDDAILMTYIGDRAAPAPRCTSTPSTIARRSRRSGHASTTRSTQLLYRDVVHGDLSAYNVLVWDGEVVPDRLPAGGRPQEERTRRSVPRARRPADRRVVRTPRPHAPVGADRSRSVDRLDVRRSGARGAPRPRATALSRRRRHARVAGPPRKRTMGAVRPWSVRAEGEVVRFPGERVEGWARFDAFFAEEHERLFKALYFVTGNREDSEELMQEAFLRLWERWHEIERIDDPTAYLFRVALNAFRSRRRRAADGAPEAHAGARRARRVHRCGDAGRRAPPPARVHAAPAGCPRARRPARVSVRAGSTHPGRASLDRSGPRHARATSDPRHGRSTGCLTCRRCSAWPPTR